MTLSSAPVNASSIFEMSVSLTVRKSRPPAAIHLSLLSESCSSSMPTPGTLPMLSRASLAAFATSAIDESPRIGTKAIGHAPCAGGAMGAARSSAVIASSWAGSSVIAALTPWRSTSTTPSGPMRSTRPD